MTSSFPNLLEVVQWARPSYNPRGTCPRWAESAAAPRLDNTPKLDSSIAHGVGGGKVFFALTLTLVPHLNVFFFVPVYSFPPPPPASQPHPRSCNGHAPLIIQEGRARAGQKIQPRRDWTILHT
jgi:hypothetical protein